MLNRKGRKGKLEYRLAIEKLKESRNNVKKKINKSKKESYKELIESAEADVWGTAYQLITKRFGVLIPPVVPDNVKKSQARNLFPITQKIQWEYRDIDKDTVPPVTAEEIKKAASSLKNRRAPGPDGIPAEAVKVAVIDYPKEMAAAYTGLQREGRFLHHWKEGRAVLISKLGKTPEEEGRLRPLCLLNAMGKLMEKIVKNRIEKALDLSNNNLSDRQYSFKCGYTTVEAINHVMKLAKSAREGGYKHLETCLVVALDEKNAFNTARWDLDIQVLRMDGIFPALLQRGWDLLSSRLCILLRGSLALAYVPLAWREIKVVFIPKPE